MAVLRLGVLMVLLLVVMMVYSVEAGDIWIDVVGVIVKVSA